LGARKPKGQNHFEETNLKGCWYGDEVFRSG